MKGFAKYFVAPVLAIGIAGTASVAEAAPVVLTTNINVWTGFNPNPGDPNDPSQQALPTNTLTSQTYVGSFAYSGAFAFANLSQATDLMSNWIPDIGLPALQMSSATFNRASLFEFTFTLSADLTGAVLTHDDGVSLFNITTNSGNLIPGNAGPTVATATALPTLTGGQTYQLWYVAANGAPSVLRLEATSAIPEPATWMLLLVGFGAVGVAARRTRVVIRPASQMV
jgi:hypothetical protein